ncbi:pyocin knob domain-containing protein [Pseudomonas sp. T1.Ur]|uniref:pyocin knob domain-containing protein n=1 Tax=Pseudomonas sp. T1.Ur TaxID=2928704 RepID=UPI00201D5BF9|nr:pyocin knob domain-containing protein [Pseudomonas sp. T1.Ur]MCL6701186.1 pyocin knob domain-containing protein [Pseudomonas sp. T1.Ur]
MPWYKAGTVSVTLNSNAVTGTDTAFIVNSRVGDAFRGPDGQWYEVTNVASNTAIAIDPPYQGPTAAAGAYALAPMQGYVKDSADQLRAIVNTYGAKLAALRTTGNYDILPVAKGGTGGTTQAEARSGIGLGTAAIVNHGVTGLAVMQASTPAAGRTALDLGDAATGTLAASRYDTTIGRIMKVGDHGIGGAGIPSIAAIDIGSIRTNSLYYVAINTGQGTLPVNQNGYLNSKTVTADYAIQDYWPVAQGDQYTRVLNNGAWTAWSKNFKQSNVVGTATQSGGVPTGSIMERGQTTNGEFIKMADGTIHCWLLIVQTAFTAGSDGVINWTLPVPVITSASGCQVIVRAPSSTNTYTIQKLAAVVNAANNVEIRARFDATQNYTFYAYLIGRWY